VPTITAVITALAATAAAAPTILAVLQRLVTEPVSRMMVLTPVVRGGKPSGWLLRTFRNSDGVSECDG
jgi:hypothetical protein